MKKSLGKNRLNPVLDIQTQDTRDTQSVKGGQGRGEQAVHAWDETEKWQRVCHRDKDRDIGRKDLTEKSFTLSGQTQGNVGQQVLERAQ